MLFPLLASCKKEEAQETPPQGITAPEGCIRIAQDGASDYRVVIAEDASEDLQKIAQEFVDYIAKITGVTLDIVRDSEAEKAQEICIGRTNRSIDGSANYSAFEEETLFYRVRDENLILTGGSDRATAYAVYDFLEDVLGVRYYSPDYEYVPALTTLDVNKDVKCLEDPGFWFRSINGAGDSDPKWMVKMRMNARLSLGSERYQRRPYVGGGIGYADWYVHTIGKLAEMPTPHMNTQPCLTDETVYQTVLKNVRAWLTLYPDATIVSISQNDGTAESAMCTCEKCTAVYNAHGKVQSALWVQFVSHIANELRDEYPDVYFDTLAYNFTTIPPQGIEIPDNVIIRIAPAHACLNHYYHSDCAFGNISFQKASKKFVNSSLDWAKLTNNLFVWDYDALFYNYLVPLINYNDVRQNIRRYSDLGFLGVYLQGDSSGSNGFSELRSYLVCKMLWNPQMCEEEMNEIIKDFMEGYYGPQTSGPLMEYISFVEEKYDSAHFSLYGTLFNHLFQRDLTTTEDGKICLDTSVTIDPMNEFFERAFENVTDEQQILHLRKAHTQVKYVELMSHFYVEYDKTDEQDVWVDLERREELNHSFYQDVLDCNIKEISEGQPIVTENPNLSKSPPHWGDES